MTAVTEHRHALITGGGTGIGAAIATSLARSGLTVTICGRRQEPLEAIQTSCDNILALQCDVTDEQEVATTFKLATDRSGPINIVIANAGAADSAPLHRTDTALWQRMLDVNLTGTFLTLREGIRGMRESSETTDQWGRLICIASNAGLKGYRYVSAYAAAKHGVVGLVRAAALELAASSVTVNAICPGFTATPLLEKSVDSIASQAGSSFREARLSLARMNPAGRLVEPEEIATAVQWLIGPDSGSINGQAIEISGGSV